MLSLARRDHPLPAVEHAIDVLDIAIAEYSAKQDGSQLAKACEGLIADLRTRKMEHLTKGW